MSTEILYEKYLNADKYRVVISSLFINIYTMQVCCVEDATDEEILACCNTDNPSGTTCGWARVVRDGEGKPGPCEKYPGRLHILVTC
jgi:hypothetical protein